MSKKTNYIFVSRSKERPEHKIIFRKPLSSIENIRDPKRMPSGQRVEFVPAEFAPEKENFRRKAAKIFSKKPKLAMPPNPLARARKTSVSPEKEKSGSDSGDLYDLTEPGAASRGAKSLSSDSDAIDSEKENRTSPFAPEVSRTSLISKQTRMPGDGLSKEAVRRRALRPLAECSGKRRSATRARPAKSCETEEAGFEDETCVGGREGDGMEAEKDGARNREDEETGSGWKEEEGTASEENAEERRGEEMKDKQKRGKINFFGKNGQKSAKTGKNAFRHAAYTTPSSEKSLKKLLGSLKSKAFPFRYKGRLEDDTESRAPGAACRSSGGAGAQSVLKAPKKRRPECDRTQGDPLYFKDAVQPVLDYLQKSEADYQPASDALGRQLDVTPKMRCVLLDWMAEVCQSFHLLDDTFLMAVNLLDRFLSRRQIARARFQLLGCASMFVASKFLEVSPPVATDFVYIADSSFELAQLYEMEANLLDAISWKISSPPHSIFINRLADLSMVSKAQIIFARYILELSVFDHAFLVYPPSLLSAAAVFASLHIDLSCSGEEDRGRLAVSLVSKSISQGGKSKDCADDRLREEQIKPQKDEFDGEMKEMGDADKQGPAREDLKISHKVASFWDSKVAAWFFYESRQLRECVEEIGKMLSHPNCFEHSIRRKFGGEKFLMVSLLGEAVVERMCEF